MRHPYAARLEMAVNSRLAVEASISDGISLGLRAGILDEHDDPVGLAIGFDDLLFPKEGYLFGQEPPAHGLASGRAWMAVSRSQFHVRSRAAISARTGESDLAVVPHFALESDTRFPVSLGWEAWYEFDDIRQSVGLSFKWDPVHVSMGFSEFQAWVFQNNEFGWTDIPPRGALTGVANPGWWIAVHWELPRLANREAIPLQVHCPAAAIDERALQPVADILQQRLLRADVAELAVRAAVDTGVDPVLMSILRQRILAGGDASRKILWRIGLDPATIAGERLQAVVTLGLRPQMADTAGYAELSRDADPALRRETAMALSRLPIEHAEPVLRVLAMDPEESVRIMARTLLQSAKAR
ncbi:MAG: HEAT repeat domain-containing protein [Fibrobacterota bacterium]|nr:MAG: HEAT repeat domain-containing protein [Fibrobacterota bacterium]